MPSLYRLFDQILTIILVILISISFPSFLRNKDFRSNRRFRFDSREKSDVCSIKQKKVVLTICTSSNSENDAKGEKLREKERERERIGGDMYFHRDEKFR